MAANQPAISAPITRSELRPADLVQITIDTTTSLVDPRQQDSGSNQSGSDSGLGYSNSISSDNSTVLAINLASSHHTAEQSSNNRIPLKDSCTLDANNNDSSAKQLPAGIREPSLTPLSKSELSSIDETGINAPTRVSSDTSRASRKASTTTTFRPEKAAADKITHLDTDQDQKSLEQPLKTNSELEQSPNAPVLRSLLKKSLPSSGSNDGISRASLKHSRNVSFNQTVIVFCEEIEAPSPCAGDHLQPHPSYGESLDAFEPPVDYCDRNEDTTSEINSRGELAQIKSLRYSSHKSDDIHAAARSPSNKQASDVPRDSKRAELDEDSQDEDYDDKDDDDTERDSYHDVRVDNGYLDSHAHSRETRLAKQLPVPNGCDNQLLTRRDVPSLTNDQILGLLENENLFETLKLNLEDLSEDDFPINQLSSSHGYLCDGAMSDYDSDSESSYCHNDEGKREKAILNSHTSNKLVSGALKSSHQVTGRTYVSKNKADKVSPNAKIKESSRDDIAQHASGNPICKSLPARVKVSMLDNNQTRKSHNAKADGDLRNRFDSEVTDITSSLRRHIVQTSNPMTAKTEDPRTGISSTKQNCNELPSRSKCALPSNRSPIYESNMKMNHAQTSKHITEAPPLSISASNKRNEDIVPDSSTSTFGTHSLRQQPANRSAVSLPQEAPACHMCRALEISRSQANQDGKVGEPFKTYIGSFDQRGSMMSNQVQPPTVPQNQTAIFDKSCLSCREASIGRIQPPTLQRGPLMDQSAVPVAYQVVHLIDQKGNRIRALSLVQPGQHGLNQQLVAGRRYLIAPQGLRYPNPASLSGNTNGLTNSNLVDSADKHLLDPNLAHYKVVRSIPVHQISSASTQPGNLQCNTSHETFNVMQRTMTENPNLRQHTVYYVQKPLDSQNIRQSFNPTVKSFPDPHEIRRLDGLKAPTPPPFNSTGPDQNRMFNSTQVRDENDDPTFGFSNRPSVKVVAPSSSSSGPQNTFRAINEPGFNAKHYEVNANDVNNQSRPSVKSSAIIYGSHTLEKKHTNHHSSILRDSITSTNSMTNIHGSTTSSSNVEPCISAAQAGSHNLKTNPDSQRAKGTITNFIHRWLGEKSPRAPP